MYVYMYIDIYQKSSLRQALQTLRAHAHTVSAGYSFANNRLFTAGFDENVLMWTLDTGLIGYLKVCAPSSFHILPSH